MSTESLPSASEPAFQPTDVDGVHLMVCQDELEALRESAEQAGRPFTSAEVIAELCLANASVAAFADELLAEASTEKDRLILAQAVYVVYHATKTSLDPLGQAPISPRARIQK